MVIALRFKEPSYYTEVPGMNSLLNQLSVEDKARTENYNTLYLYSHLAWV